MPFIRRKPLLEIKYIRETAVMQPNLVEKEKLRKLGIVFKVINENAEQPAREPRTITVKLWPWQKAPKPGVIKLLKQLYGVDLRIKPALKFWKK
jgi:hypothetical protein